MAGRRAQGPNGLVPREAPAADLTAAHGLEALDGARMVDVARRTLDASERMVGAWAELEPIVRTLIGLVRAHLDAEKSAIKDGAALLGQVASVTVKIATAAGAVLRASEGQTRLALLVAGPGATRTPVGERTEKQLLEAMVLIFRRTWTETGVCPTCRTHAPILVGPGPGAAAPARVP
jgi:hypothetical protein